ncbi:MAG: hypothetical protein JXA10_09750 [Anaerolineae bacterium]|nr:hypothetical protein [Anaerolineae bacterium]
MTNRSSAQPPNAISLEVEYSTPYSAMVREDVVMGVPRYFLERWVPVLGPQAASLVNTLRQLNYRCQNDTVTISGSVLAREAAISRRHLYTCLETPWIEAFVRPQTGERTRNTDGQIVQQANHYHIRMDDPLTPADAAHLVEVLRNLADTPVEAARRAIERPPRELWANAATAPAAPFTEQRPLLALDAIKRAFPTWQAMRPEQNAELARAAEQLHRHITLVNEEGRTNKIIVPQYFRRHWWARLGHDLAWVYLWLRGQVYDNPSEGIQRDLCWVDSLNTLLELIGRTREWWRRNVETAARSSEPWTLADFFAQTATQKGRDSSHPQWVARQFRVALTIPIAPEDQKRYSDLLTTWPLTGRVDTHATLTAPEMADQETGDKGSATNEHIGLAGVCHNSTHRLTEGPPQINTPDHRGSATDEHTGSPGVCHNSAQGSATPAHTESESYTQAPKKQNQDPNTTKHLKTDSAIPTDSEENERVVGAGAVMNIGLNTETDSKLLIDQLAQCLESRPQTPLYDAAPTAMWLHQAWPEPIRPHTPLWALVMARKINARDLIALMLAVWADSAIKHPPRYLSWLAQRWQAVPELPPVDHWAQWRELAALPIGEWFTTGRQQWIELVARDKRDLPFGLDVLRDEIVLVDNPEEFLLPDIREPEQPPVPNGLDVCPGNGRLSISDIWRATLGQLSVQLNRSTYANWVEGARAVSYADGVLTVRARHPLARDWLAQRLNHSIEETASFLAEVPIKICYTADP